MCERVLGNSRYTKQTSILPHIFKLCIYLRLFHVSVFSVLRSMCICRSVFVSLSVIPIGIYLITSFHHTNIVATRTTIKLSNRLSQNTKLWGKRRWKYLWWITLSWPSMQWKQTLTQTMLKREDFLQDSLGCRPQFPNSPAYKTSTYICIVKGERGGVNFTWRELWYISFISMMLDIYYSSSFWNLH